jgi:hypothetical protein
MPLEAKRLNDQGLAEFSGFLTAASKGTNLLPPESILDDPQFTSPLEQPFTPSDRAFGSRFEIGMHLTQVMPADTKQSLMGDVGFWSWLALYWFNQLCPANQQGHRKASKPYNYMLSTDYRHRYRHAIFMTWQLVERFGDSSLFMLGNPPHKRGDIIEQIASRQFYASCDAVIGAASRLYFDESKSNFKAGSTSKLRKGSVHRYIKFLDQLDLTYDLGSMSTNGLVTLLPSEYKGFLAN